MSNTSVAPRPPYQVSDARVSDARRVTRRRQTGTAVACVGALALLLAWPVSALSASTDTIAQTTYTVARLCDSVVGPDVLTFATECERAQRGEVPVTGEVLGNLTGPVSGPPRVVLVPALPPGPSALPPGAVAIVVPPGDALPSEADLAAALAEARAQDEVGGDPTVTVSASPAPTTAEPAPTTAVPPPVSSEPEAPSSAAPTSAVPTSAAPDTAVETVPIEPAPAPVTTADPPPASSEAPAVSEAPASPDPVSEAPVSEAPPVTTTAEVAPEPAVVETTVVPPPPEEEPGLLSQLFAVLF